MAALASVGVILWLPAEAPAGAPLNPGRDIYNRACVACHGSDGSGSMPEAPDLTDADGPLSKPDAILLESIMTGTGKDPASFLMPPKGGDAELTEEGARQVLRFMRTKFGPN